MYKPMGKAYIICKLTMWKSGWMEKAYNKYGNPDGKLTYNNIMKA